MLGNFQASLLAADFLPNQIFLKILTLTICMLGNFQAFFDILLGLTWVQTVCKAYQQMTKVMTSRQRVRLYKRCHMRFLCLRAKRFLVTNQHAGATMSANELGLSEINMF